MSRNQNSVTRDSHPISKKVMKIILKKNDRKYTGKQKITTAQTVPIHKITKNG